MDELAKNHILQIKLNDGSIIEGIVSDFEKDRVFVLVDESHLKTASKIQELDELFITAHTHYGIKKMKSHVISTLNSKNILLIENNPTIPVIQKREFVRVSTKFNFGVEYFNRIYKCLCVNISAGGIAFKSPDYGFFEDDKINIILPNDEFGSIIKCTAKVIKTRGNYFVAKFENLNSYDENKIVKRVFELLSKK